MVFVFNTLMEVWSWSMNNIERSLHRRLLELGLSSNEPKLFHYFCGYTVMIRGATYAVDENTANVIKEIANESR